MLKAQTLKLFLQDQKKLFAAQGVESYALCAELLLASALRLERPALLKLLLMEPERPLSEPELASFAAMADRRLTGEPMAYILGEKEFYGRSFKVSPAVLIPRPETELLVDTAKSCFKGAPAGRFADLGTGSGCIAVTLALEMGADWRGIALDKSPEALDLARQNAARLGAAASLEFTLSDFRNVSFEPQSLELVVSNPPYVSEAEYAVLDDGVRNFEPKSALVPGGLARADGAEDLAAVAALAAAALKSGGILIMEFGASQGQEARALLEAQQAWREIQIIKDLAGLDRLALARR